MCQVLFHDLGVKTLLRRSPCMPDCSHLGSENFAHSPTSCLEKSLRISVLHSHVHAHVPVSELHVVGVQNN